MLNARKSPPAPSRKVQFRCRHRQLPARDITKRLHRHGCPLTKHHRTRTQYGGPLTKRFAAGKIPYPEALVTASNGACVLVKINVDELPAISDQLKIQSLPTVMLMVNGKFVDEFKVGRCRLKAKDPVFREPAAALRTGI